MFAFVSAPLLFRVIRATTLSFASREFVVAARATGAKTSRILLRELLPNIVPAAVSFALIGVALPSSSKDRWPSWACRSASPRRRSGTSSTTV